MPLSTATLTLTLDGVALVTGGASGLGRGVVLAFADLGAKVAIADINMKGAEELASLVNAEYPGHAIAVLMDVSDEVQIEQGIKVVVTKFGRLDYAINSAGIVVGGDRVTFIKDTSLSTYDRIQQIDARGMFLCMKHELRAMVAQALPTDSPRASRGVIINMASRASLEGIPKFGAYCSAKHAVLGMSKVASVEHAKDRIRVIAVCPGLIKTPGHVKAATEVDDAIFAKVPFGRFGVVEEITDAVVWLCTNGASYMTGATFEVDGGCAAL